jgi:hypothetical protein
MILQPDIEDSYTFQNYMMRVPDTFQRWVEVAGCTREFPVFTIECESFEEFKNWHMRPGVMMNRQPDPWYVTFTYTGICGNCSIPFYNEVEDEYLCERCRKDAIAHVSDDGRNERIPGNHYAGQRPVHGDPYTRVDRDEGGYQGRAVCCQCQESTRGLYREDGPRSGYCFSCRSYMDR